MRLHLIAATLVAAFALTGCATSDDAISTDAPPGPSEKYQNRVVDICVIGKFPTDVEDFRAVFNINWNDVPRCGKTISSDYVATVTRSESDDNPPQLRVRFVLTDVSGDKPRIILDKSSTGTRAKNETYDQTAHRLIRRDWDYYLVHIGLLKQ